jgi:hypothetical protein
MLLRGSTVSPRHHSELKWFEDYVWVSLGNAMKAKQSKAKWFTHWHQLESWCASSSLVQVAVESYRPHQSSPQWLRTDFHSFHRQSRLLT